MAQILGSSGGTYAQASSVWASHNGQWVSISTGGGGTPAPSPLRLSDYAGTPIDPEQQSFWGTWGSASATWDGDALVLDFRNVSAGIITSWYITIGVPRPTNDYKHMMRDHPDRITNRHTTAGWFVDDTGTTWTPAAPMVGDQGINVTAYWVNAGGVEGESTLYSYMAGLNADGTPFPRYFGEGRTEYSWDPPNYQPAPSRPYNWFGYLDISILVFRGGLTHPGGTIRIPKLEFGYHMNPDAPVPPMSLSPVEPRAISVMDRGRDFAISWLAGRGAALSPDALVQLTDEELLGLVVDLLDSERP